MAKTTYLTLNEVYIQYPFLSIPNATSKKYSIEAIIPENHPQFAQFVQVCNDQWAQVAQGSNNPQSMGYTEVSLNPKQDGSYEIKDEVRNLLDPNVRHFRIRATQPENAKLPHKWTYDGGIDKNDPLGREPRGPALAPNDTLGDGSKINLNLGVQGYSEPQKGVKCWLVWTQIVELKENKFASASKGPATISNGYVASQEIIESAQQQMQQPIQQHIPQMGQVPMQQQMGQQPMQQNIPQMGQQPIQQQMGQVPTQQNVPPMQQAPVGQVPTQQNVPPMQQAPVGQVPTQQNVPPMQQSPVGQVPTQQNVPPVGQNVPPVGQVPTMPTA